jgi:hypothetical protein
MIIGNTCRRRTALFPLFSNRLGVDKYVFNLQQVSQKRPERGQGFLTESLG